jgi:hypothetical protein
MPIKKKAVKRKPAAKKKAPAKKRTGGIASYVRSIFSSPGVKKVASTIKSLEAKLKAAKKKKAAAVKIARKKIK